MKEIPCSQTNQTVTEKYQFLPPAGNGRGGVKTYHERVESEGGNLTHTKAKFRVGCTCRQVWNISICCKVCNRQEQQRGLRNNDKDT